MCMSCQQKTSVRCLCVCVFLLLTDPRSSDFGMPQTRARIYFLMLRSDEGDDVGEATMDPGCFFELSVFQSKPVKFFKAVDSI